VTFPAETNAGLLVINDAPPVSQTEPLSEIPDIASSVLTTELVSPSASALTVVAAAPASIPILSFEMPAAKIDGMAKQNAGTTQRRHTVGAGRGGGTGYVPPQFRLRYKPPYPQEARAQCLEGTVLLLVSVDAKGRVTDASIRQSSGHAVLDRVATETVRSWRFDPARQDGASVASQVEVPVRFRFEDHRIANI
jgi:protein TonB